MDIKSVVEFKPKMDIHQIRTGDTVKVSVLVREGERERSQHFQGIVIRVAGGGASASFTVRRVSYGVGVERTFLANSPLLQSVQVLKHGDVRRAYLTYLRGLSAKEARTKERARALAAGEGQEMITRPEAPVAAPQTEAAAQPEAKAAEAPAGAKKPEAKPVAPPAAAPAEAKAEAKPAEAKKGEAKPAASPKPAKAEAETKQ